MLFSISDRKRFSDILHFSFDTLNTGPKKLSVRKAKLMFHVASAEDKPHPKKDSVKLTLKRLKSSKQYSNGEKLWERDFEIPQFGNGEWHQTDMTKFAKDWHLGELENHGITLEFKSNWMKNYVDIANGKNVSVLTFSYDNDKYLN